MARPAVVGYMRLVVDRFELYFSKILRDLGAGVPASTIGEVRRIASRFGVGTLVAPRIDRLVETARVARLL